MEKNWICIYTADTLNLAEIAKGLLREHDIDSVSINKQDSTYHFGTIEVYVERENVIQGKHVLRDIESPLSEH